MAAVELDGQHWGIPISNGNHLMLLCNSAIVDEPPATTDELVERGTEWTTGDQFGLVYNLTEPFWLALLQSSNGNHLMLLDRKSVV